LETSLDDPLPSVLLNTFASLPPAFFLVNGLSVLALLVISGLVSGSEVAFFSLSPEQVKSCENSDHPSDHRIARLIGHPQKLLATILILNNLVNICIVTISTFAVWQLVGDRTPDGLVIVVLTGIVTVLIIFFGEVLPKVFATQSSLNFARATSGFIYFFDRLLTPVSFLLLRTSRGLEKRIQKRGYSFSMTELHHALEVTSGHEVTSEEKGILKGIVNFGTISVKQVMRQRLDITAIDMELDFHQLMDQINKTGYSRLPVYAETLDNIEGVLYIKDLLPHIDKEEDFDWRTLIRPPYFVPETKKIDDLLRDFQARRVHMALVVDEYGGTEGLITLEDVMEEIVGEINDEFDEAADVPYTKIDSNTFVFEGKTSLTDFCKVLQVDTSRFDEVKGESESLGGLLLELNTKLPKSGEKIAYSNFLFTVIAVDQRRIKRVRVYISPDEALRK
jgi:putative hemolysin